MYTLVEVLSDLAKSLSLSPEPKPEPKDSSSHYVPHSDEWLRDFGKLFINNPGLKPGEGTCDWCGLGFHVRQSENDLRCWVNGDRTDGPNGIIISYHCGWSLSSYPQYDNCKENTLALKL